MLALRYIHPSNIVSFDNTLLTLFHLNLQLSDLYAFGRWGTSESLFQSLLVRELKQASVARVQGLRVHLVNKAFTHLDFCQVFAFVFRG